MSGLDLIRMMIRGEIKLPSMAETIPMILLHAENGLIQGEARAGEQHLNPTGIVHGGFAATVIDTFTGIAVLTELGPGDSYVTTDLSVKMLKEIPKDVHLRCEGKSINISKRLGVAEARIKDELGNLFAHGTASCYIKRNLKT